MRVDLNTIDTNNFMIREEVFNGEKLFLIQPALDGCEWNKDNLIFRSSIWNSNGELVSASFFKFFNWGEKPELAPIPKSLEGTTIMEKLDGSLLIVSKYRGKVILRTRGTFDAFILKNGPELELFKAKELRNLNIWTGSNVVDTWTVSFLFEWVSPKQRIVLNYGDEPKWFLVGVLNHKDYSLWTQKEVDWFAKSADLKRPVTHTFGNLVEMVTEVDAWKGKEGVVLYSNGDQLLHKVKATWYLTLHRKKTELASRNKVIDVWLTFNRPKYWQDFFEMVANQFGYELATQIDEEMKQICDAWREVEKILKEMEEFVSELNYVGPRSVQARAILAVYGNNRSGFAFKMLDHRPLDNDDYKKLLYQCINKNG